MGHPAFVVLVLAAVLTPVAPAAAAAALPSQSSCTDHVRLGGLTCAEIPGICTKDPLLAHLMCPSFCGRCDVYDDWKNLLLNDDVACRDIADQSACEDFKQNNGDCSSPLAQALCRETCAPRTANFTCVDHTTHLACEDIPGVCNGVQGVLLCPQYCNLCDVNLMVKLQSDQTCPPPCVDLILADHCVCSDTAVAVQLCPFTCFNCSLPAVTESTTTPTTTATPETTTTTLTTTTTTPSKTAAPKPGSMCVVCGDMASSTPCTDLELLMATAQNCPDSHPYCMNDVVQVNQEGQRSTVRYKRCVDQADCHKLWFEGTSDIRLCREFDPNSSTDDITCHLCCYGDQCNMLDVPPRDTWYHP